MSETSHEVRQTRKNTLSRGHGRRRWFLRIAVLCAGAIVFWASGGAGWCFNSMIAKLISERDYENAESCLILCEKFRCSTPHTILLKARLYRKQLRIKEVGDLLKEAQKAGVDKSRIRKEFVLLEAQTGRIRNVADELNTMLVQESEDGAEICEAYVNGAMMIGATDVAMTILPVWKQEYPQDPQPHYAEARILEYQQDIPGTIRELETAISRDPRHWPSLYALSRVLHAENRIEDALTRLALATAMKKNAAPKLLQAKCLRALGKLKEAHEVLFPLTKLARQDVLQSFSMVGEPERGLQIEYELGTLEAALGNHAEARRLLDNVLVDDPNHLDARYARAISMRELGERQIAEEELAEVHRIRTLLTEIDKLVDVINRNPEQPHLEERCRIGELFIKYANARQGVFWIQGALNRDPRYQPAHKLLADYYDRVKQREPEYSVLADQHREAAEGGVEQTPASGEPL